MIDVFRSFLCLSDVNSGGTVSIVCNYVTTWEKIANMKKGMIARTPWLEVAYCAVKEIRKILSLNLGDIVFPQVVKNQNCDWWEDSARNCLGSIVLYIFNPFLASASSWVVQDWLRWKLQLSHSCEHCFNCQLWALNRKSFKFRWLMNTKKSATFAEYQRFNLDKNKNERFDVIERQQKLHFSLQFSLLKASFQIQKSTFTAKFSPRSGLQVIFFAQIRCPGWATGSPSTAYWPYLDFQHHDRTACWEIARNFDSVPSFPHIFGISLQPLRPTTQILRLPCFSVVANSKICRGRSRNSSAVESQSYFVSRRPFQHVHEQQANEVRHFTRFFEKVDS